MSAVRWWLVPVSAVVVVACSRAAQRVDAAVHVRALRRRSAWRVPAVVRGRLVRALERADVDLEPEAAVTTWALAVLGGSTVAAAFSPSLVVLVLAAALVGPPVAARIASGRRERRFAAALPAALETIAADLRGGSTVPQAVERVAAPASPVAPDLRRVGARAALGLVFVDALAGWPREHDRPPVRAAAGALAVATTMGGPAAGALDGLASSLRDRLDAQAEAHALSSQARLSAVVVGVAPLGYLAFSALVDPGAVDVLVGTTVGRVCLLVGLGLEGLATIWIRRIVGSTGRIG
ncbi:MAG: type II secretion system F family protein [Acidimicrobiia bacterium]